MTKYAVALAAMKIISGVASVHVASGYTDPVDPGVAEALAQRAAEQIWPAEEGYVEHIVSIHPIEEAFGE